MKKSFHSALGHWMLISVTIIYLSLLIIIPNIHLFFEAFRPGLKVFFDSLTTHYALAALKNTMLVVFTSLFITVPLGVLTAFLIVRDKFFGKRFLDSLIDLPFAAPAAIGAFALISAYGPRGVLGPLLDSLGFKIIFARPGMILATVFVTLPFVIREVIPVLEEIGREPDEAAHTLGASRWQALRLVTLPYLKDAILYGVSLSYARALGEFGAILVISGNILGVTQTMPIYIYDSYIDFQIEAAYIGAVMLIFFSLAGRGLLEFWRGRSKV